MGKEDDVEVTPKPNKSCRECRRRKIRCDGRSPCSKCVYYQIPECQYYNRKRRRLTSQRHIQESDSSQDIHSPANQILSKLFPSRPPQTLLQLTSTELVHLAQDSVPGPWISDHTSPVMPVEIDRGRNWNESQELHDQSVPCDDVNGLSLDIQNRSYMGVSSTRAILRAMFDLKPSIQSTLSGRLSSIHPEQRVLTPSSDNRIPNSPTPLDDDKNIDGYFAHIHSIIPLIDESEFRNQWRRGDRADRAWLALANMVLALGSVSASDPNDHSHEIYYNRVKGYIDIEFLGIGCIESLQALCLLGGCYLHYINSPNMAYTIMGAAFRLAIALGLHREPKNVDQVQNERITNSRLEARRRTWWCMYCLDAWGSMTLGRPTLGRWDPASMNIRCPNTHGQGIGPSISLAISKSFCVIASKVQDRFAHFSPITCEEIRDFDLEVEQWYHNIPPTFRDLESCPDRLISAQFIMRNRYLNIRLLLYRPVLLNYSESNASFGSLQLDEQTAIQECREIACRAVDQVSRYIGRMNRIRVWSASWYLYQACLVLLLSILRDSDHLDVWKWKNNVVRALESFEKMTHWSVAAARSRDVVGSIYAACATRVDDHLDDIPEIFDTTFWDQVNFDYFSDDWNGNMLSWADDLSQFV